MRGSPSRAATKCISEVPGLAKQASTPQSARVRTRLSAPFIALQKSRIGAAIHQDVLRGDEAGVSRAEEGGGGPELVGFAEAAGGDRLQPAARTVSTSRPDCSAACGRGDP